MVSSLLILLNWICESLIIHGFVFIITISLIACFIVYIISAFTNITITIKHETVLPNNTEKKVDLKKEGEKIDE